jgi:hypothetical protein
MKPIAMEGEVWWIARPDDIRPVEGLSIHDVFKKIQEIFSFVAFPTTLPLKDQGFVFREGVLRRDTNVITVKFLEIYNDGIHFGVDSSTDDADIVFHELRKMMVEFGAKPVDKPLLHYHVSSVVCEFDNDISEIVSDFRHVTELISSHLDVTATVGLRGIHFAADAATLPTRLAKINPTLFRIEPRYDATFDEKRYFSFANMTTANHMQVLTSLDRKWRHSN